MINIKTTSGGSGSIFDMHAGEVAYLFERECGIVCLVRHNDGENRGLWLLLENSQTVSLYGGNYVKDADTYKVRNLHEGESFMATFS
jgi:hypothetical protein